MRSYRVAGYTQRQRKWGYVLQLRAARRRREGDSGAGGGGDKTATTTAVLPAARQQSALTGDKRRSRAPLCTYGIITYRESRLQLYCCRLQWVQDERDVGTAAGGSAVAGPGRPLGRASAADGDGAQPALVRDTASRSHGLQGAHRPGQGGLLLSVRQSWRYVLRQLSGTLLLALLRISIVVYKRSLRCFSCF